MSADDHLNAAQFKVKLSPAQAGYLAIHDGGSEYLNRAQDAGVSWHEGNLVIPSGAVPHISAFLNMRRELANDYQKHEEYKDPETSAEHRVALNLHKKVRGALGDQMDGH